MVRKFPPFRSKRKKRTTSGGSLQLPNGFSGKLLFHLTFNRNFLIFLLNGKHPGSLGRRLLMTSTHEPNTMAPQSALCICLRKWKTRLINPMYFGTKTSKFCFRIISFSSLESGLSFDSKDSEINFDLAQLKDCFEW